MCSGAGASVGINSASLGDFSSGSLSGSARSMYCLRPERCSRRESSAGRFLRNDVGVSITLFDSQDAVQEAHRRAMTWIRDNLSEFYEGEPDVTMGEVVVSVPGQGALAA